MDLVKFEQGLTLERHCNLFSQRCQTQDNFAFDNIIRFLRFPKERVENKTISAATLLNHVKREQALEASPIATAIIEFMRPRTYWIGTATELLAELEYIAESLKIRIKKNSTWPTAPNRLGSELNEVKTDLRQVGIKIERHTVSKTNTRKVEIREYRIHRHYRRRRKTNTT